MADSSRIQDELVAFSEGFIERGDSPAAVGWHRGDADARYKIMLELVREADKPATLLDFGCGLSHLNEYIIRQRVSGIEYSGLDLSDKFLAASRAKFPRVTYYQADVLNPTTRPLPTFDYVVMNGIFTYRGSRSYREMVDYMHALVARAFALARVGLAFNVITKQVEWERDDLFHVPIDELLTFLSHHVSRHVVIRHDYGLFEYTAYVFRTPSDPAQSDAKLLLASPAAPPAP